MNILLVEDNPSDAGFIKKGLSERGHHVDLAYDGLSGKNKANENTYDLVILDIILPYMDGFELCRQIRLEKRDLPILILTALDSTADKVKGLQSGADDYLVRPFHFDELLARVHALHRRSAHLVPDFLYHLADLEVDIYRRTVRRADKEIILTATEFSLLELLIANKNQVLSRAFISSSVWGINHDRGTNVVTVYINYLRAKIDKGFYPTLIHTIINSGYVLKEP